MNNENAYCKTIRPAGFKALYRILEKIYKILGTYIVVLQNSKLQMEIEPRSFYLNLDMKNILNDDNNTNDTESYGIDASFLITKQILKDLKLISGKGVVTMYQDDNFITFANGNTEAKIWKNATSHYQYAPPTFCERCKIGESVFDIDHINVVEYVSSASHVMLRCFNGQLEQLAILGRPPYTFDKNSQHLLRTQTPDLVLCSKYFLTLAGKLELTLSLQRNESGYWLVTTSRSEMAKSVTTIEHLFEVTGS